MGHNRLGKLARTYRWKQVINLLEQAAEVPEIVNASMRAAQNGLLQASHDPGLTLTLTNVFKFIEAVNSKDNQNELIRRGLLDRSDSSIFGVLAKFREKVDNDLLRTKTKSDVSEIAVNSFLGTLNYFVSHDTKDIFAVDASTMVKSLQKYTTKSRLPALMHEFYSRFTKDYLSYHLSREMSNHVGPDRMLDTIDQHRTFNDSFDLYIRQAVRITKEFTPGWYGKAQYEGRLNHESVKRYAHVAFKKIISEIR